MRTATNLETFIDQELDRAVFDRLDSILPEFGFVNRFGRWESPLKNDGVSRPKHPRKDKTVVTGKAPALLFENGESRPGQASPIVKYIQDKYRLPWIEAIRYLAEQCNLTLPSYKKEDTEAYERRQQQQKAYAEAAEQMKADLFNLEEAKPTLDYLRNSRGYSEDLIKAMGLGYCSRKTAEALGMGKQAEGAVGKVYTLAIPYLYAGKIQGFNVRDLIPEPHKDKYQKTAGMDKGLFGLGGINLTGDRRHVTLVEGELDALHAQAMGVDNVFAMGGSTVNGEALRVAKKFGVKSVTILYDYGEDHNASSAIKAIAGADLIPYVATWGEEYTKGYTKMDVDDFLNAHSAEELRQVIGNRQNGTKYLAEQILREYYAKPEGLTDTNADELRSDLLDLLTDNALPIQDREAVYCMADALLREIGISRETLQTEVRRRETVATARKQQYEADKMLREATDLMANGSTTNALRLLATRSNELTRLNAGRSYADIILSQSKEATAEEDKNTPEEIKLGYYLSEGSKHIELGMGLEGPLIVAALPSHGKSTMLRNMALRVARQAAEGECVIYFSFEENKRATRHKFINLYLDLQLTEEYKQYGNLSTIEEYYRTGSTRFMKGAAVEDFARKQEEFMQEYWYAGKILIPQVEGFVEDIIATVEAVAAERKVKAVFVDYLQMLNISGWRKERREELSNICKQVADFSKNSGIPFALAAQLNREALSPTEMHMQNIAECADIERYAGKILLMWNCKFNPLNKGNYKKELVPDQGAAMDLPTRGKMYVLLAKSRNGDNNLCAALDLEENKGEIKSNAPTPKQAYAPTIKKVEQPGSLL